MASWSRFFHGPQSQDIRLHVSERRQRFFDNAVGEVIYDALLQVRLARMMDQTVNRASGWDADRRPKCLLDFGCVGSMFGSHAISMIDSGSWCADKSGLTEIEFGAPVPLTLTSLSLVI